MKTCRSRFLSIVVVISIILAIPFLMDSNNSAMAVATYSDYSVSGYINPANDLTNVYFIGMYNDYFGKKGYFAEPLNSDYTASQQTSFSFTASYMGNAPSAYLIVGVYNTVLNDPKNNKQGATVGSNLITTGTGWDSLFYNPLLNNQYTEDTFMSLLSGSYIGSMLGQFYDTNKNILGTSMGTALNLVNFSDASNGGSAYATLSSPVPLPATLLFLGPGLLSLAAMRKKIKK